MTLKETLLPLGFYFLVCTIGPALCRICACVQEETSVKAQPGVKQKILGVAYSGECFTISGEPKLIYGTNWVKINFKNESVWIAEQYVRISDCDLSPQLPGCPTIVTRAEWKARPPKEPLTPLPKTPYYAFIHHGDSPPCFTKEECIRKVQAYQKFHMDTRGWLDIGYSFVVGEDGNAYEGRGWDKVGSHTLHYNSIGLGFCVIGNFTDHVPNNAALKTLQQLIKCGKDNGKLINYYTLRGHRDVRPTTCPGQKFYELIRTWPHYWKS